MPYRFDARAELTHGPIGPFRWNWSERLFNPTPGRAEGEVMLITPDSSGDDPVALTVIRPLVDQHGDKSLTPKGPTGLLRALIDASTPHLTQRALPAMDTSIVAGGASLFDYDAALALDLDGEGALLDGDLLGGGPLVEDLLGDDLLGGELLGD